MVRDHLGHLVAARTMVFEYVSSPLHIEALAARKGLLAAQRGFHNFVLALCNGHPKVLLSSITGATAAHARHQKSTRLLSVSVLLDLLSLAPHMFVV